MRLVIFGATGSVGILLVDQALKQGHTVTAFTRNPQKLSSIANPRLNIFKGDVLDAKAVERAIQQQDCVLCAIGDGTKGTVRAAGTKNILSGMKKANVGRLICQTTLGLGTSRGNLNFFWKNIMFGLLLKKAFRDHQLQEKHVFDSDIDFTIVRPGAFVNGKVSGNYKIGFDGRYKKLKLKISRADVAEFMLKQVHSADYVRQAVSISN